MRCGFASMHYGERGRTWGGLLALSVMVLGLALTPPFLSPRWGAVVMQVFAPVCHQIPVRSPHIGEIQIAICDRCTGIYLGVVIGVLGVPLTWAWRRAVLDRALPLLIGVGGVLLIDWVGPLVGGWSNSVVSRVLTGGLFGVVAGLLAGHGLLRSRSARPTRSPAVESEG